MKNSKTVENKLLLTQLPYFGCDIISSRPQYNSNLNSNLSSRTEKFGYP